MPAAVVQRTCTPAFRRASTLRHRWDVQRKRAPRAGGAWDAAFHCAGSQEDSTLQRTTADCRRQVPCTRMREILGHNVREFAS
mmetsp:Transcript_121200/g.338264  ORF Transcript_121200/g.338264 Transcript_121200/m.338264 type:complete len:83 (-) Transcript_121200:92-340(-)